MRHPLVACAALSLGLSFSTQAAPPSVATDIAPVHSLVSQVMEGVAEPKLIIPAGASPHSYSLRPSEARALAKADIVFWVGEGLTPWLEKALDNIASSAQKIEVLDIKGTTSYAFREGATFESHDHDDHHEGEHHDEEKHHKDDHHDEKHHKHGHHDEHHAEKHHKHGHHDDQHGAKHRGHDDHHGHKGHHDDHHGEGAHNFEWAGTFELSPGEYIWSFAKVDGNYADPKMKMVMLASQTKGQEAIEATEATAERLIDAKRATDRSHGNILVPNDKSAYQLIFDASKNITEYRVIIRKKGTYTFFTEHMPFEFEADEHFFKDAGKQDIEPTAQEPAESGHHHDHSGADPHAWLDPENAKVWVQAISEVLAKKDPENAATYQSNAASAIASLDTLIADTKTKIDALGQPQFIVFHDAYQYFEKRFGISAAGSISLGDAEDPSPARIKEIRETVKKLGVSCVFTEPQYNPGLVKNVFAGTKISTIGVMDPLGAALTTGSGHYQALIQGMVDSLSQCQ